MLDQHTLVQRLTNAEIGHAPFIEERLAIEARNALRGGEIGLLDLRSRPGWRRLWEGITGEGQERGAAIGQDLLVTQRALLGIVHRVITELCRKKSCTIRVLENLHQVNRELDTLRACYSELATTVKTMHDWLLAICNRIEEFETRMDIFEFRLQREAEVRRMLNLYQSDVLHPGMGTLFGSSLYLAQHTRHFAGGPENEIGKERSSALAVVMHKLARGDVLGTSRVPLVELFLNTIATISLETLESAALVTGELSGPYVRVLEDAIKDRLKGCKIDNQYLKGIVQSIVMQDDIFDPDKRLSQPVLQAGEFVAILAEELNGPGRPPL